MGDHGDPGSDEADVHLAPRPPRRLHTIRITNNNPLAFAASVGTIDLKLNEKRIGFLSTFSYGQRFDLDIRNAAGVAVSSDLSYAFVGDWYLALCIVGSNATSTMMELEETHDVGSKIGIIKDPFGASPKIIAATTPIPLSFLEDVELNSAGTKLYANFRGAGTMAVYDVKAMTDKALSGVDNFRRNPLDGTATAGPVVNRAR